MANVEEIEVHESKEYSYNNVPDNDPPQLSTPKKGVRNLIGFWLLGLCNNYGYVIMLSAAHDLLNPDYHQADNGNTTYAQNETHSNETICNPISTGAILLADILPTLLVKLVAPFISIGIHYRVIVTVILASLSFIITSFSTAHWMTFVGVICASFSSGLGEPTFLSYSSFFDKNVISTWSSGTGAAGVVGALSYASLTHLVNPRTALLIMLIVPVILSITFWILIEHPTSNQLICSSTLCSSEMEPMLQDSVNLSAKETPFISKHYTFRGKLALIKPLLKYMIPLGLVYFAEYFINQGLMELLYFPNALKLNQAELYRWYQVDYQFGVLISRSSVNCFQIHKLWILPILQFINLIFLLTEVRFAFIPSIWLVLFIILYEGLLGGSAYVNTFYKISYEVPSEDKEFSLSIASLADSIGIALAGAISLPVHKSLCEIISH